MRALRPSGKRPYGYRQYRFQKLSGAVHAAAAVASSSRILIARHRCRTTAFKPPSVSLLPKQDSPLYWPRGGPAIRR